MEAMDMRGSRFSFLMVLIPLLMLCFISVPVLSDSGEEDPWDADNDGNSDGAQSDTLPMEDVTLNGAIDDDDSYSCLFSSLVFTISLEITDYFFGDSVESLGVISDKSRNQSREDASTSVSSRN
jgi:hypothetical protein